MLVKLRARTEDRPELTFRESVLVNPFAAYSVALTDDDVASTAAIDMSVKPA